MSVRYFCDCCGNEITDANRIESDKGRLFGILRSKVKGQTEPLQVEVTTALGSTWNAGHFCKYCVIDAVNSKDDRPMPATVPEHKLRESETRYTNLLLDLQRVMDDQPTICNFPEVEQLRARIAGVEGALGDGAERRVEAFAEKRLAEIRACANGCGAVGQCKANAHGNPSECVARGVPGTFNDQLKEPK